MSHPSIGICISSHISFYQTTLPRLLGSLEKGGIEREDVFVTVGGVPDPRSETGYGEGRTDFFCHRIDFVTHNSFDFTALINVVESGTQRDYWLLLHDTCEAGPLFRERLSAGMPEDRPPTVCLQKRLPSANIGLYARGYLAAMADLLPHLKDRGKSFYMFTEDVLFIDRRRHYFQDTEASETIKGYEDVYGTGTQREVLYYEALDLYKFKANIAADHAYTPITTEL